MSDDDYFNFKEFYDYLADQGARTFVELGVYGGASLEYFVRASGFYPVTFYGIDLWEKSYQVDGYDRQVAAEVRHRCTARLKPYPIVLIQDDCISAAARPEFKDGVDAVFIDDNHEYDHVRREIQAWLPRIKPGGIISGHDYGEPCGVKQAVDEIFGQTNIMGTCWWQRLPDAETVALLPELDARLK